MISDEDAKVISDIVTEFFKEDRPTDTRYERITAGDYRTSIGRDGRSVNGPGGTTLLWRVPNAPVLMFLDFLHDYPDLVLIELRESMLKTLEEIKAVFIPVSFPAFQNATRRAGPFNDRVISLVDRVGLECVFSVESPHISTTHYYISGFDRNEPSPLYFLARLPHAVDTFDEAIESLKPNSVKTAEREGLEVLRQGDMFAIPTDYTDRHLTKKLKATFAELDRDGKGSVLRRDHGWTPSWGEPATSATATSATSLYGTAHHAATVAKLPDGTMFGKGEILHLPNGRNPDHQALTLAPADWYLIVKNAVPIQEVS